MQYEQVYSFLIDKLEHNLPAYLSYHNVHHTKSVIESAEHIAKTEGIAGNELLLLKTAALFHDSGFLQHHQDHEELSCKLARRHLPDYGYAEGHIDAICQMIMATKIPQSAADHMSQVLCDADLYYLGTPHYAVNADNLFREFKKTGYVKTQAEWDLKQVEFLSTHHYYTEAAIKERAEHKNINLQKVKERIESSFSMHRKQTPAELLEDFILLIMGVVFAGFALKGFMIPNHFFDGGITGVSLLVHEFYPINLSLIMIVLNIPLIIVGYFSIGKKFAYRAFMCIALLGVCMYFIPDMTMTSDKLLISIFGGIFLGIGVGMIIKGGAALDGADVLALYTLKKTSFSISEIILAINILVFAVAAMKFGIETALYSVLTYLAAARSIDYVVEGWQAYTGVTIISGKSEVIKYQLVNKLGRGITVYKGERGFLPGRFEVSSDCDIIFTVITRLELRKLKNLVYEVDPKAFVFSSTITEASGGIISRRSQH